MFFPQNQALSVPHVATAKSKRQKATVRLRIGPQLLKPAP
jgi:hypothetical protein